MPVQIDPPIKKIVYPWRCSLDSVGVRFTPFMSIGFGRCPFWVSYSNSGMVQYWGTIRVSTKSTQNSISTETLAIISVASRVECESEATCTWDRFMVFRSAHFDSRASLGLALPWYLVKTWNTVHPNRFSYTCTRSWLTSSAISVHIKMKEEEEAFANAEA